MEMSMKVNIARYYKQERLDMDCEIITPMFLGNASQEAELRAAPFKALLRYWWRIAEGGRYDTPAELLAAENEIFGSADADSGGRSLVTVEVEPLSEMVAKKDAFTSPGKIDHPECERTRRKTDPLNYLAGMGLIHYRNGILHSYFPAGAMFRCSITGSRKVVPQLKQTLGLMSRFATIGSRSRNGWGSFSVKQNYDLTCPEKEWKKAFDLDYPHCLGKDNEGSLFWRTQTTQNSWEQCMKELADVYVSIRAGNPEKGIERMEVNAGIRPDRHLLGYPVTNHSVARWGQSGRHGSALRLLVRKEAEQYRGCILHLPHLYSTAMWPEEEKDRQIQIWQSVHRKLDTLCQRVSFEEAQ